MRFNDTAGSMSRDSVFNAASVVRALCGSIPSDYDLHVNVIGGGNIDGPSAGLAFFLALYSAITRKALPQDIAVTGEVSLAGNVRGVGGSSRSSTPRVPPRCARSCSRRRTRARSRPRPHGIESIPVRTIADVLPPTVSTRRRGACARGSPATFGEPEP